MDNKTDTSQISNTELMSSLIPKPSTSSSLSQAVVQSSSSSSPTLTTTWSLSLSVPLSTACTSAKSVLHLLFDSKIVPVFLASLTFLQTLMMYGVSVLGFIFTILVTHSGPIKNVVQTIPKFLNFSKLKTTNPSLTSRTTAQSLVIEQIQKFVHDTCGMRPPSHNHVHMLTVKNRASLIAKSMFVTFYTLFFVLIYLFVNIVIRNSPILMSLLLLIPFMFYTETFAMIDRFNFSTLTFLVEVVALLHDVADHKYIDEDSDLKPKLILFLEEITKDTRTVENTIYQDLFTPSMINAIIDRISFSRQKKHGSTDWLSTLGYIGVLVRNIVSDADKLEAIGPAGIDRCISYTIEMLTKDNKSTDSKNVYELVEKHYHEKLKTIATTEFMMTLFGWLIAKYLDHKMKKRLEQFKTECEKNPNKLLE